MINYLITMSLFITSFTLIVLHFLNNKYFKYNNILTSCGQFILYLQIIAVIYFIFYSKLAFFGKLLLLLCVIISFIVSFCINSFSKYYYLQIFILYTFTVTTYYLVSTSNILTMLVCYELLMIPSILLLTLGVYSRRTKTAVIYFFFWTQIGSFFVFFSVILMLNYYNTDNIEYIRLLYFFNNKYYISIINILLFLGFGIKIPVFPFYFWLIHIHVEASTGFSIFLSGFLVKTAIFLYNKWCFFLYNEYKVLYLTLCLIGSIDSSFKFWLQTDLKKIIAYATVQEMNMIFFFILFDMFKSSNYAFLFCFFHGMLSSLMFFCVELIYRRSNTRNIDMLGGFWIETPKLSKICLCMIFLFLGIPCSFKFILELLFLYNLFYFSSIIGIIFSFITFFIAGVGFIKSWFKILFSSKYSKKFIFYDISKSEFLISFFLILLCSLSMLLLF